MTLEDYVLAQPADRLARAETDAQEAEAIAAEYRAQASPPPPAAALSPAHSFDPADPAEVGRFLDGMRQSHPWLIDKLGSTPAAWDEMLAVDRGYMARLAREGGYRPAAEESPEDLDYYKWAATQGIFARPSFSTLAGDFGRALWRMARGGYKLARHAGRVAESLVPFTERSPEVALAPDTFAATAVEAAQGSLSELKQLGAGSAALWARVVDPQTRLEADYALARFAQAEQAKHGEWRRAVGLDWAPVDPDEVEVMQEFFDPTNALSFGAGKAAVKSPGLFTRGLARVPGVGHGARRAVLVGQAEALSEDLVRAAGAARHADDAVAALQRTLAADPLADEAVLAAHRLTLANATDVAAKARLIQLGTQEQLEAARDRVTALVAAEGRSPFDRAGRATLQHAGALAGATLAGAPSSAAFGYVASGGDLRAAAESAGSGAAFGLGGGLVGTFEPKIAALLAGKTQADALATLHDALAEASPEDRAGLIAALHDLEAAITPRADDGAAVVPSVSEGPAEAVSFATERDQALTGGGRAIAAQEGAFQWPNSNAKDIDQVAADMSLPGYRVTVRGDLKNTLYVRSEKGGYILIEPDGNLGEYRVVSPFARGDVAEPKSGGTHLYQTALTWAHNNGFVIVPDESISKINRLRRTSAMLSSALRHGTTDHMLPHADQGVSWIPGDHEANIAALARREAELAFERLPEIKDWSIDFRDGTFLDRQGNIISGETAERAIHQRGGPIDHGVGLATLRRALLTTLDHSHPGGIGAFLSHGAENSRDRLTREILYAERAGGAGPEGLDGNRTSAARPRLSEAGLKRELATIRKAFPEFARHYALEAGELEKLLRARGYEGEVPAAAIAALARLRGQQAFIGFSAQAFRDRAAGAALLTHEVGHAYWDTLSEAMRANLRALHLHEIDAKTGPLYRDGQFQSELAHVEERSERGAQEWFAERIARLNESWAHGRLDRADLPLLRRLAYSLREKLREIWTTLARRERLDPHSDLFENRFREFFAGGAQVEGRAGVLGTFEPKIAALLAGKTHADALATLQDALAEASPEDRAGLIAALHDLEAAITPRGDDAAAVVPTAPEGSAEAVSFATERDQALTGDWRTLAAQDGAFQWPHSDAKLIKDIARDMSVPGYNVKVSGYPESLFFLESEKGGHIMLIPELGSGRYRINSTYGRIDTEGPNTGGTQLYQAALTWAHNNGFVIVPDQGITWINQLRRTGAMLSSALRHGTTDHMLPHADQGVSWTPGDYDANIAALARREAELVFARLPETKEWSIDIRDGTLRDGQGNHISSDAATEALYRHGGPRKHGVGLATVRRALLTRLGDSFPGGLAGRLSQDAGAGVVPARGVLYAERALRGAGAENLGGDSAPASRPGFSAAELKRELATIRRAFPALLRRYDLQAGEVEKLLRARGHTEEVSANAAAALLRLGGERGLIVFGVHAFRDRASGAALLTHEVGHAYWDTLDDATRQTLRDLRARELESKTGPLFRDGRLNTRLAHVDEASERGVQEWFAERIARLNESWAHGRLDRADLPLLRRLAYRLRKKLRELWTTLARRERLDPTSELFERRFRRFFAGGAKVNAISVPHVSYGEQRAFENRRTIGSASAYADAAKGATPVLGEIKVSDSGITIQQREGNLIISSFKVAAGEAEVITELYRTGDTLILRRTHISGRGTLQEAVEAARKFGREQGAKNVLIEGGKRTTGAKPRHFPKPLLVKTGL